MRWLFWTTIFGLLMGTALYFSSTSHAATITHPAICATFDASPTFASVNEVMQDTIDTSHLTIDQAAQVVVDTVASKCPQYISLLRRYVEAGTQEEPGR